MKASTIIWIIVSLITAGFLIKTCTPTLDELSEDLITGSLEADLSFIGGLLPVICESDGRLIRVLFDEEDDLYFDNIDDHVLYEILTDVCQALPRYLEKIEPGNLFYQKLQDNLLDLFTDFNEHVDVLGENEAELLIEAIEETVQSCGSETYFEDKRLLLKQQIKGNVGGTLRVIYESIMAGNAAEMKFTNLFRNQLHTRFMKNLAYAEAYQSGCLKIFMSELERAIAKEDIDEILEDINMYLSY